MPTKSQNSDELPRRVSPRAERAWQRLTEWYGERFTTQYGRTPPPDWARAIDNATNDLVKRALSILRAECVEFPPTFPQFAKALRPPRMPRREELTVQDRLAMWVARRYHARLTQKQFSMPWTYYFRDVIGFSETGKEMVGAECVAVEIPQRDGTKAYRITVAEMETAQAAA